MSPAPGPDSSPPGAFAPAPSFLVEKGHAAGTACSPFSLPLGSRGTLLRGPVRDFHAGFRGLAAPLGAPNGVRFSLTLHGIKPLGTQLAVFTAVCKCHPGLLSASPTAGCRGGSSSPATSHPHAGCLGVGTHQRGAWAEAGPPHLMLDVLLLLAVLRPVPPAGVRGPLPGRHDHPALWILEGSGGYLVLGHIHLASWRLFSPGALKPQAPVLGGRWGRTGRAPKVGAPALQVGRSFLKAPLASGPWPTAGPCSGSC